MFHNVQDRLLNWWSNGDQARPCMLVNSRFHEKGTMDCEQVSLDDYWLNPACHVRRAFANISCKRYFGEALPYHYVDFGASTLCGMQGCKTNYSTKETIWVDARYGSLEDALNASIDDSLLFTKQVHEVFELIASKLHGYALVAPYCFGSPCDNLAGLIGTENLIYSLYDNPRLLEQVLVKQLGIWMDELDYVTSILKPSHLQPMTAWHGILAPGSTFAIQEDIGYMLGDEHYNRFCLPGIYDMVDRLEYPFFHLDGVGALKHLDALLAIDKLKVIQWQPGEGHMQATQWYEVVTKILTAGKSCQLYVQPEEVAPLVDRVGAKGLLLIIDTDETRALKLVKQYNLEENMVSEVFTQ